MKTIRITSLLLLVLSLTAYALPARVTAPRQPAPNGEWGQAVLLHYRWLRDTELPELLAWLRARGPFTSPAPADAQATPFTGKPLTRGGAAEY